MKNIMKAKRTLAAIALSVAALLPATAQEGRERLAVSAGFLFNSTINASVGWEKELAFGNAVEVFGEAGDRWQKDPVCGKVCKDVFWKNHYWDGGVLYKKGLRRMKNSTLRLRIGPVFGAYRSDFFYGLEGGFEYNYVFKSGVQFSVIQKNNVCFRRGDDFRNGLLIGIKVPI